MRFRKKNKGSVTFLLLSLVLSMLCLAYASVPLYRIFCRVTGYGGTVRKSTEIPYLEDKIGKHNIKVRLNADVHGIPILFHPEHPYVIAKPGVRKLAFYIAENYSDSQITGMAVYNVAPYKAGKYFNKVACFCFSQQSFSPKRKVVMPVSFFIDPAIEEDPETKDIREITLSYSFFKSGN